MRFIVVNIMSTLFLLGNFQMSVHAGSEKTSQHTTSKRPSPLQQRYMKALLLESFHNKPTQALQHFEALAKHPKATSRLQALCLFHATRMLLQQRKFEVAKQRLARLQKEFGQYKDLILHLESSLSRWSQRKLSLKIRKASYRKIIRLLSKERTRGLWENQQGLWKSLAKIVAMLSSATVLIIMRNL